MKTLQDIRLHNDLETPLGNNWSVKNAIKERVEQEDFLAWAKRQDPIVLASELPVEKPTPLSLFVFFKGILP